MSVVVFCLFVFGSGLRLVVFVSYYRCRLRYNNSGNEFQDELVGNRCNRSLGLTLRLTVFDVTPSVISLWDRIAACQFLFFFLYVKNFLSKCCSVNNIA